MDIIPLYEYEREGGGTTVSPIKPDTEYTEKYRLVADEGKLLTNDGGKNCTPCIDVDTVDGWEEIDNPEENATEQDLYNALAELGVTEDE